MKTRPLHALFVLALVATSLPAYSAPGELFKTADHAPQPIVQSLGGRVLVHPKFIPISIFNKKPNPNDPLVDTMGSFLSRFVHSAEWELMLGQYGVEKGSVGEAQQLSMEIPADNSIDDGNIRAWLLGVLNGPAQPLGPPEENTVYALLGPENVKITLGHSIGCIQFGGYHEELLDPLSNKRITYIVIPHCTNLKADTLTIDLSHEIEEAVTNPDVASDSLAYYESDPESASWTYYGGELGDMCWPHPSSRARPDDIGYLIQQPWSNADAQAGRDPCDPIRPEKLYFNAAPVLSDDVPLYYVNGNLAESTKGILLQPGQSKTIALQLFSTAPTSDDWEISFKQETSDAMTPALSLEVDKDHGSNGDIVHLTVTAPTKFTANSNDIVHGPSWATQDDEEDFVLSQIRIMSTLKNSKYYWPLIVGVSFQNQNQGNQ